MCWFRESRAKSRSNSVPKLKEKSRVERIESKETLSLHRLKTDFCGFSCGFFKKNSEENPMDNNIECSWEELMKTEQISGDLGNIEAVVK